MTAKEILDYISGVEKKNNIKVWTKEKLRMFQDKDSDYSKIEFDQEFNGWFENSLKSFYSVEVRRTTAKKILNNAYVWCSENYG
jgi:hypothetical protein